MEYIFDKSRNDVFTIELAKDAKIIVKKNVKVYIIEQVKNDCNVAIYLEDDASLNYISIDQTVSSVINKKIIMGKNSNMDLLFTDFTLKGKKGLEVFLDGEGAIANIKGIVMGKDSTNDLDIKIIHNASKTTSKIENYITSNNALINVLVEGKITVKKALSNCSQKTRGIIMSKNAKITVLPTLLIDEYDVMANHGASIGKIDEDGLYYLMSRGISKKEAEALIINGFLSPIIDGIVDQKSKDLLNGITKNKL